MARRLFDIAASLTGLLFCGPLILFAAVCVRMSSSGPAFYCATRVGRGGKRFTMYKLRTMHVRTDAGSSITAADDRRIFPLGRLLRAFKIDELPQLVNILRGDMAVVGPRPEAPDIVDHWYTADYRRTLQVRPGLTSPGSIRYYEFGEDQLADGNAEDHYGTVLLPQKMAADLAWLDHAGLATDIGVILRTAAVLIRKTLRKRTRDAGTAPATATDVSRRAA